MTVNSNRRPTKKQLREEKRSQRQGLYAKFVRGATLANGKEEEDEDKEASEDEEEEEREARSKVLSRLTDEQLMEACQGMTAHK